MRAPIASTSMGFRGSRPKQSKPGHPAFVPGRQSPDGRMPFHRVYRRTGHESPKRVPVVLSGTFQRAVRCGGAPSTSRSTTTPTGRYSDRSIPGPWAAGQRMLVRDWHILKPLIDTPFFGGPATGVEDIPLELNRHGVHRGDPFHHRLQPGAGRRRARRHRRRWPRCTITEKVVAERRVHILRDLGARAAEARNAEEA
jgi:hypothetical protein